MYDHLNDYEIIHLIVEGHEQAFSFMVIKYHPLIAKKIRTFHLSYMYEDIYQDSLMVLHRSIYAYDPSFKKTFMRFFEMNLVRSFITVIDRKKRKEKALELNEDSLLEGFHSAPMQGPYYEIYLTKIRGFLTEFEYFVFYERTIKNLSVEKIALKLSTDAKSIYNAIDRAKRKINDCFKAE